MATFPFDLQIPKTNIFIETGTSHGASSILATKHYEKVYTMDIVDVVSNTFKDIPNIFFYNESSITALPKILDNVNERTTFWLDAHPNNYKIEEWPLFDELRAIAKHSIKNHNLIFDDIDQVLMCGYFNQLVHLICNINPDYKLNMNIISTDRSLNTLIVTI